MCVCVCVCVCIYIYVCVCIYIYMTSLHKGVPGNTLRYLSFNLPMGVLSRRRATVHRVRCYEAGCLERRYPLPTLKALLSHARAEIVLRCPYNVLHRIHTLQHSDGVLTVGNGTSHSTQFAATGTCTAHIWKQRTAPSMHDGHRSTSEDNSS